jgi:hypothetical protein
MDRRNFLRLVLASPLAAPLLSRPRTERHHSALYLIADNPQDYLPAIVTEMKKRDLVRGNRFSLPGPHPFGGELRAALARRGWEVASGAPAAAIILSFQPLRRPTPPSACLTVATFSTPAPFLSPGRNAAVFIDGKKRETLSLTGHQERRYRTLGGEVLIRVENGRAEVLASSCRHKICQSSGPAFLAGERIVCAPNHFLLAIDGPRFVDTVTG